jgi:hypothetical protein
MGKSMAVGNEGAGVVFATGEHAQHLVGKVVGAIAKRMYTRYRKLKVVVLDYSHAHPKDAEPPAEVSPAAE